MNGYVNELIPNNDFCCLEELCSITHTPSDITKFVFCQPINTPVVKRYVNNLCSVFLIPEQEGESKQNLGGQSGGSLNVTATLDSGASSRDYISSSLAELLVAMGAKEEKQPELCAWRAGAYVTQLHKLLFGIRCIYLLKPINMNLFLQHPRYSQTQCQTL